MEIIGQFFAGIKNLFTWWVTVVPWEQSVRVRLGNKVTLLKPGVHLRLPVLDRFYVQPVRLKSADIPIQTMTTKDGQAVTVGGNFLYQIVDVLKLYETLHHANEAIVDMVASAIAKTVCSLDRVDCSPQLVEEGAAEKFDMSIYGIDQTSVHITDFAFVKTYRIIHDRKREHWNNLLDTVKVQGDPNYG